MSDVNCADCRWSTVRSEGSVTVTGLWERLVRRCRCGPPDSDGFPVVNDDDWCSAFEKDPRRESHVGAP